MEAIHRLSFLDIAKPFDSVWHEGLLYKLHLADVPLAMVQLIDSFLNALTFRAHIGHALSAENPISAGVSQGSAHSFLLYAIFTPRTSLASYTDDTAILVRTRSAHNVTNYLHVATDLLAHHNQFR